MYKNKFNVDNNRIISWHASVTGAVGGVITGLGTSPFNALKIQHQSNRKYDLSLQLLLRGAGFNSITLSASLAWRLTVNGMLLNRIPTPDSSLKKNYVSKGLCAFLAGMSSSIFLGPMELGMALQQQIPVKQRAPFLQIMANLTEQKGYSILKTGMLGIGLRDGIVNWGLFHSADYFYQIYNSLDLMSEKMTILSAGTTAGLLSQILSQPFDTLKTRKQISSVNLKPDSYFQIARDIYTKQGIFGFWAGSLCRGTQIIVNTTFLYFFIPWFASKLQKSPNPHVSFDEPKSTRISARSIWCGFFDSPKKFALIKEEIPSTGNDQKSALTP